MSARPDTWMKVAERVDAWRVFPRVFVFGYGALCWDIWTWVRTLPDLSPAQSAFVTTVLGLCIPLLGWYFNTGRDWTGRGTINTVGEQGDV